MVTGHHHLPAPAMEAMSQNTKLCFAAAECMQHIVKEPDPNRNPRKLKQFLKYRI